MLPPPNSVGMKNGSAHIINHTPTSLAHASSESYIPLDSCMSGGPLDQVPPPPSRQRRGSNTSIPDMVAPPPPSKSGKPPPEGAWDPNATYDSPSKSYINDENTYKVKGVTKFSTYTVCVHDLVSHRLFARVNNSPLLFPSICMLRDLLFHDFL